MRAVRVEVVQDSTAFVWLFEMRFGGFWVGNAGTWSKTRINWFLLGYLQKTKMVLVRVGNDCNAERWCGIGGSWRVYEFEPVGGLKWKVLGPTTSLYIAGCATIASLWDAQIIQTKAFKAQPQWLSSPRFALHLSYFYPLITRLL